MTKLALRSLLFLFDVALLLRHQLMVRRFLRREPSRLRWISIANPRCANDKFHWRKIFDHNPLFTTLADKIDAKPWIREVVPELGVPELLWHGTDPELIPDALLQGDVVLKASHSYNANLMISGGKPDRAKVNEIGRKFLAKDHARRTHQWGYYDIPPRLLIEEWVGGGKPLHELKYHVCGQSIERVVHIHDRFGDIGSMVYDFDHDTGRFAALDEVGLPSGVLGQPLPPSHDVALPIVRKIGAHFDYVRVDLLTDGERLWFGELTFYSRGGFMSNGGWKAEPGFSRNWDLRRSWFLTTPQSGWRRYYAAALRRVLNEC